MNVRNNEISMVPDWQAEKSNSGTLWRGEQRQNREAGVLFFPVLSLKPAVWSWAKHLCGLLHPWGVPPRHPAFLVCYAKRTLMKQIGRAINSQIPSQHKQDHFYIKWKNIKRRCSYKILHTLLQLPKGHFAPPPSITQPTQTKSL